MATPDGAASFSVDLARAPQAIASLQDSRDQLHGILRDAYRLQNVAPPAQDPVSRDAATVLGQVANGGSGSLVDALRGGIARLDEMIDSLNRELASYRQTESDNVRTISGRA